MSLEYRAPRAVREESTDNDSDIAQRIAEPMSFEDVLEIRSSWKGTAGIEWANKITQDIAERADFIARFEERANAARIGEGTYVSWPNSDGSRNQGKVEKVTTRGQLPQHRITRSRQPQTFQSFQFASTKNREMASIQQM